MRNLIFSRIPILSGYVSQNSRSATLAVFKWDGFLEKIFQENGLDPYKKYPDEQLQGLTEQFTLVETEKGLLVFRSMKIVFIKDRYQLESAEVGMFFEK